MNNSSVKYRILLSDIFKFLFLSGKGLPPPFFLAADNFLKLTDKIFNYPWGPPPSLLFFGACNK